MPDWIVKYWVQWLFGGIGIAVSSVATWIIAKLRRDKKVEALAEQMAKLKQSHKELEQNHQELKGLLEKLITANHANQYDKLYYLHGKFIKQGWISVDDMRNVRNIYESYHALGGNGHGTALYNDLDELPSYRPYVGG
ncbi:hypothetical protein LJC61_02815 [Ruminococcaceae bacterium OttesenSCG-928-A16]|nr:hypothetical protein [Ruminococcaceae bacterium OttesenSCG-928-A16]